MNLLLKWCEEITGKEDCQRQIEDAVIWDATMSGEIKYAKYAIELMDKQDKRAKNIFLKFAWWYVERNHPKGDF